MAKTQFVFPPDAGSTNAGAVPTAANCGRGIPRTGDIRHRGDNYPPSQTATLTPGTIGQNVLTPAYDSDQGPGLAFDRGGDAQAAPEAFGSAGKFGGLDASGEGFDPFSGKQGGQA